MTTVPIRCCAADAQSVTAQFQQTAKLESISAPHAVHVHEDEVVGTGCFHSWMITAAAA